ncbi:RagB/SusD family nutrient uptake outer membrane protein [Fulvivirga sp. 29W222]|uniref:RagB/SusD family nutrient uptake outer membrane protein n=1 Tax=Fulvivirga marina TaxID=2494733 RepID=A0A937FZM8_9BACT|nr:RagB/SusD family nutrient uptake outer membrane protein [Fulvivirga marina]MBL6449080.1 RagB/SusD family nutrient uptake outer membrane protein [Fulvivirga marina]
MKTLFSYILIISLFLTFGCSDLEEELNDGIAEGPDADVDVQQLLNGAYGNLRDLQSQDNLLVLTEHPTDEMAGPTRGRDWDDAGIWRVLHRHSWTTAHAFINNAWRTLNRNAFNAQQVLCSGATGSVAAQATFLRVFNDFLVLDNFGKIPRRACDENLLNPPSELLTRGEASAVLISELEAVLNDLPTDTDEPALATQNAARALLAKLYLNKAVYAATDAEGGAEEGPYNFAAADMDKVIAYVDGITGRNLDANYFDNFIPDNGNASDELIFVSQNTSGGAAGNARAYWFMTLHYNQNPSGWNGFVALSDLYNRFEQGDQRLHTDLPYLASNGSGLNAGLLVGQQYDVDGNPLEDRAGNPLVFTEDFNLLETGSNLEVTGIRAIKYPPDFTTEGDAPDNDFVFLRYADALLMKAEAIMRGGTSGETALDIVNQLRTIRGASTLVSLSEQDLLDERSRELYWEGWRRNDLVRFNSFLGTWQEKPSPSDKTRLLFPIPSEAISTNPELEQNPGY